MAMDSVFLTITCILASLAQAESLRGGHHTTTRVEAYDRDEFVPIVFLGGRFARVEIIGDGDTDLDLYVYDAASNLVAKDDDNRDYCIATWTPTRTQAYTIVVVNLGDVYNKYV